MPQRPQTRADLIELVSRQTGSKAMKQALILGTITLYGGFLEIGSDKKPGWVMQITSQHGRVWLVGILADGVTGYRLSLIKEVPWKSWDGKIGQTEYDVYSGDEPDLYDKRRRAANGVETEWLGRKAVCDYIGNRDGVRPSTVTIHNWETKGRIGADGERRILQSREKAGKRFTTVAWIDEFLEAL